MRFGPDMRLEKLKVAPPGSISTKEGSFYGSEGGRRVPDEDYGESFWFWCPGCDTHHSFRTKLAKGEQEAHVKELQEREAKQAKEEGRKPKKLEPKPLPIWTFNGDMESPTFSPSLLYYGWKDQKGEEKGRCHLHLRKGVIEYCADCSHRYAGQKVPLPEMP